MNETSSQPKKVYTIDRKVFWTLAAALILIFGWTVAWPTYAKSECNRSVTTRLQKVGYPYINREYYSPLYNECLHKHGI